MVGNKEDVFQSRIEAELDGVFDLIDDDLLSREVCRQTEHQVGAIASDVHVSVSVHFYASGAFQVDLVLENQFHGLVSVDS